jgi:hypothetical protein
LFWQMTRTTPLRRMILHFSHIGLTDGRTFMIPFGDCAPAPRLWLPQGRRYRVVDVLYCAHKRPQFEQDSAS